MVKFTLLSVITLNSAYLYESLWNASTAFCWSTVWWWGFLDNRLNDKIDLMNYTNARWTEKKKWPTVKSFSLFVDCTFLGNIVYVSPIGRNNIAFCFVYSSVLVFLYKRYKSTPWYTHGTRVEFKMQLNNNYYYVIQQS